MRRLLSIDEIYEKVKDYDLVISNDIALVTALNSRISFPWIGYFAMTPLQIATLLAPSELGTAPLRDVDIIAEIQKETGYSLRYILSEVLNFRDIRRYTNEVTKYITTKSSRNVYNSYEPISSIERVMGNFEIDASSFFKDKRVAAIGVEFFDSLDKRFNSSETDIIEIFTDEEYRIPEIWEIGNDRQIADNAVDLIDPEKPDDYAIVLNTTSPIADAVRAGLYRCGLPFINRMSVRDMAPIRDFISFISLSFSYDTLRVSNVKELFSAYNGFFGNNSENYLLHRLGDDQLKNRSKELRELMRRIKEDGVSFNEVRIIFNSTQTGMHVQNILNDLRMGDDTVTPGKLADLSFAIDNIPDLTNNEQTPESEKSGVLLVDCTNSVYIDRPVVIYLGMEQDWNIPVIGKRYIDAEGESEKNAMRLEALLQQGQKRIYLVNTTKRGDKARPCNSFPLIMGDITMGKVKKCDTFADICDRLITGRWVESIEPVLPEKGTEDFRKDEFDRPFSKSSYDNFYSCPRKFMFAISLNSSDNKNTEFGNLIHEFAEFYVCHRDYVIQKGVDYYADFISKRFAGISSQMMSGIDSDKIRYSIDSVMKFIDENCIETVPLDSGNREEKNPFFEDAGFDRYSSDCECDHRSFKHPIHGKFDLMIGNHVVDYKTGSPQDIKDIVKSFTLDSNVNYPEFQPLLYLAIARDFVDPDGLTFKQFYVTDKMSEPGSDKKAISSCVRSIRLHDGPYSQLFYDEEVVDYIHNAKFNKTFAEKKDEVLESLRTLYSEGYVDPMTLDTDEAFLRILFEKTGVKDNKTGRKDANGMIHKTLNPVFKDGMVILDRTSIVTKELIDSFLSKVDADHQEVRMYYTTDFPPKPRKDCTECEFKEVCMKSIVKVEGDSDE